MKSAENVAIAALLLPFPKVASRSYSEPEDGRSVQSVAIPSGGTLAQTVDCVSRTVPFLMKSVLVILSAISDNV